MSKLTSIFSSVPQELCERLEEHYNKIKESFVHGDYEPSELNGGKFCEIVIRILEWHVNGGTYTPLGQTIKDFGTSCRSFESKSSFDDSIRFHIPQILNALYPIRNKRGVAHHAKEVNPNHMDAVFTVSCADWVMAELVRLFHNVTTEKAQQTVEGIITKKIPVIWEIGTRKRVLSPSGKKLAARDKVLILLYHAHPQPLNVPDLLAWTEYGNSTRFRDSILKVLHDEDLVHFDQTSSTVHLSLLGVKNVETKLPLDFE